MAGVTRNWANIHRSVEHLRDIIAAVSGVQLVGLGQLERFDSAHYEYGATISLSTTIGSFEMGLFCQARDCEFLVERLFGGCADTAQMESRRLDALGEVANMVLGRIKEDVVDATGELLPLAVPRLFDPRRGESYATRSIPIWSLQSSSEYCQFCLTWSERNSTVILDEVLAILADERRPGDYELAEAGDLLAEILEGMPEELDGLRDRVEGCRQALAGVLGRSQLSSDALSATRGAVVGLLGGAQARLRQSGVLNPDPHGSVVSWDGPALSASNAGESESIALADASACFLSELPKSIAWAREMLNVEGSWHVPAPIVNQVVRRVCAIEAKSEVLGLPQIERVSRAMIAVLAAVADGALELGTLVRSALGLALELMLELCTPGGQAGAESTQALRCVDTLRALLDADLVREDGRTDHGRALESTIQRVGRRRSDEIRENIDYIRDIAEDMKWAREADSSPEFSDEARQLWLEVESRLLGLHTELTMVPMRDCTRVLGRAIRQHARRQGRLVHLELHASSRWVPAARCDEFTDLLVELAQFVVSRSIEDGSERTLVAKARLARLRVTVNCADGYSSAELEDDGRGFMLPHLLLEPVQREDAHVALDVERLVAHVQSPWARDLGRVSTLLDQLDATLEFHTRDGEGCRIRVVVPHPEYRSPQLRAQRSLGAGFEVDPGAAAQADDNAGGFEVMEAVGTSEMIVF